MYHTQLPKERQDTNIRNKYIKVHTRNGEE